MKNEKPSAAKTPSGRTRGSIDSAALASPASRLRPFARSLPMQLMKARELVMQHFRPHLNEHDLTDQQWRIIRALAEGDALEIGDLGERCCIHPASLSRILPKLDAAGLTCRRAKDDDKRRMIISITPQGRRLFNSIAPGSDAIYAAVARKLGVRRLQDAHRVLDEVIEALSEKSANGRSGGAR
jgi:homoprotocatechuate degradation regulator HpaR